MGWVRRINDKKTVWFELVTFMNEPPLFRFVEHPILADLGSWVRVDISCCNSEWLLPALLTGATSKEERQGTYLSTPMYAKIVLCWAFLYQQTLRTPLPLLGGEIWRETYIRVMRYIVCFTKYRMVSMNAEKRDIARQHI